MLTGLDHVVIAVHDPVRAAAELEEALGIAAGDGGRHEFLGTHNRIAWLGDSYLELIGVEDAGQAATSWVGRPVLESLAGGGGFVALAIASDDLASDVAILAGRGSVLGAPQSGERTRADGRVVRWHLALPPALGPDDPAFLIEHLPGPEWDAAARADRARQLHPVGGPVRLARVELGVRDVRATTSRFARDLGLGFRPSLAGSGARDASVGVQVLRVSPRRSGAPAVLITLRHRGAGSPPASRTVDRFGCRFVLEGS